MANIENLSTEELNSIKAGIAYEVSEAFESINGPQIGADNIVFSGDMKSVSIKLPLADCDGNWTIAPY